VEGEIAAGDDIVLVERDRQPISVAQCIAATLLGTDLPDVLRRLNALPHLSQRWRGFVSARLGARRVPAET
jgi:MOSC domain-containing protein YiiM